MCEQAILATKAVNEKARAAAYGLLVEIGHSFIRWHPELTQRGCSIDSKFKKNCLDICAAQSGIIFQFYVIYQ